MKKNVLIKEILGTDSVKLNPAVGVTGQSWQAAVLTGKDESSATKTESKMQPIYEFKYSQRCYCGRF